MEGYRKLKLRELQMLLLSVIKEIHLFCVREKINYYLLGGSMLGAVRHGGFIPWDDDIDIGMPREDYEKFKSLFPKSMARDKYFLQCSDTDQDFAPAIMRLCIRDTFMDVKSERHLKNCKNSYIDIFPLDNVPNEVHKRTEQEKRITLVKRLIDLKLYHIYDNNSKFSIYVKKIVSVIMKIIPLSYLQKKLEQIMRLYQYEKCDNYCSMASQYSYSRQTISKQIYGIPKLIKFEDTELYGSEYPEKYLAHLFGVDYMQLPPEEKRVKPQNVYVKIK